MLDALEFLRSGVLAGTACHTRFAPSPTGFLHVGHAYSAMLGFETARATGGTFFLRIEDIDRSRCRPEFELAIQDDLNWLGIGWDGPIRRQHEHIDDYRQALRSLSERGVVYPCFCSRRQIAAELDGADRAPHGPSGEPLYPGTCRDLPEDERQSRLARGDSYAIRLDVRRALRLTGRLFWHDLRAGRLEADPSSLGDVVLARKDTPTSYHLAVTVDDALQERTLVARGEDLFHATHVHRLLQALLDLPSPHYFHHELIADSNGQRMSKRNRAVTLRHLRDIRRTPEDIWSMFGLGGPVRAVAV